MLYTLLTIFYVIICILLAFIILIQKGKSNMGLGAFGGGTQMLFGGSGGQDIFQKITWVLAALFMAGSMCLAIMKTSKTKQFKYAIAQKEIAALPMTQPIASEPIISERNDGKAAEPVSASQETPAP